MSEGRFVGQADAVSTFLVDMQIKLHMVFPQRLGEHQAVLHRHGLVFLG